jgi:hypothetical protein
MSDILDRINVWADGDKDTRRIMEDAAAEIEHLRLRIEGLNKALDEATGS